SRLTELVTPPYDVIAAGDVAGFEARSPHNFIRLIRPGTDYAGAARRLEEWIASGVLRSDEPSMYVHEVDVRGATRRDLIAAMRLEPYDRGIVLPHERTHRGPKEDRLALLRATGASLEPLWFVFDGAETGVPALLARAAGDAPLAALAGSGRRMDRPGSCGAGGGAGAHRRRSPPVRDDARLLGRGRRAGRRRVAIHPRPADRHRRSGPARRADTPGAEGGHRGHRRGAGGVAGGGAGRDRRQGGGGRLPGRPVPGPRAGGRDGGGRAAPAGHRQPARPPEPRGPPALHARRPPGGAVGGRGRRRQRLLPRPA